MFLNSGDAVNERRLRTLRLIAMLVRAFGIGPRARHSQTQPLTFHGLPSCPRKGEHVIDGKKLSAAGSPRVQKHVRLA